MAIYVDIRKDKELNKVHSYNVETSQFGGAKFYIVIDEENQKLYFYHDNKCIDALIVIDFNDRDTPINCSPINPRIVWAIVSVVKKALENRVFPEIMDYAA